MNPISCPRCGGTGLVTPEILAATFRAIPDGGATAAEIREILGRTVSAMALHNRLRKLGSLHLATRSKRPGGRACVWRRVNG